MALQDINDLAPIDQHLEKEHQEKTKVKNIQTVEMGKYEVSNCHVLSSLFIVWDLVLLHLSTAILPR